MPRPPSSEIRPLGLATHDQVRTLLASGVSPGIARVMSADHAASAIHDLSKMTAPTQGTLFQ